MQAESLTLPAAAGTQAVLPWLVLPALSVAAWVPVVAWPLVYLAGAALLVALLALWVPKPYRGWACLPAAILLGLAWGGATQAQAAGPRLATAVGTVTSVRSGFTQILRLSDVRGDGVTWQIGVDAPPVPLVQPGDRVRVHGLWTRDDFGERIVAQSMTVLTPREHDLRAGFWRATEDLSIRRELASTLLLGRGSPPERKDFRDSGLAHLLAVSGMHLGIAAALGWWVMQQLRLSWRWRIAALLLLVVGYTVLTGAAPATRRAAAMVIVAMVAMVCGREPQRLGLLAAAALLLVVVNPGLVHDLGFQLSVTAVFGILTVGNALVAWRRHILPLQPWPLDRLLWRGVLAGARSFCDGLAIGIGATLVITPLVAATFQYMYPWSPLATVLAAPLVTVILWLGLPWMLLVACWSEGPWAGLYLILDTVLAGLAALVQHTASWPGARLTVSAPPWGVVLLTPWCCLPCPWWLRVALSLALLLWWWIGGG